MNAPAGDGNGREELPPTGRIGELGDTLAQVRAETRRRGEESAAISEGTRA